MLVGPPEEPSNRTSLKLQVLLYDRTEGTDRLHLPRDEERVQTVNIPYRKREPVTTLLIDEEPSDSITFGRLSAPESADAEATQLVHAFRGAAYLSDFVQTLTPSAFPATPEAFHGIDHLVLASSWIAHDPAGLRAVRQWLQRGGRVWVMLDRVEPDVVALLLEEDLNFQVLDRTRLTSFQLVATGPREQKGEDVPEEEEPRQQYDRSVDFVRVLLPAQERVRHTVNGWPAWFSRPVGKGRIVFTTLGPRGWYRPGNGVEPPVPGAPLAMIADELQLPAEEAFRPGAFTPLLTEEIGYTVVTRSTIGLILAGFLLATLALGILLRRSRRPELLSWLPPAAALATAAVFVVLGEVSRRAAPPTVAVGQVVDAVAGSDEVAVHGLLATYRPDSGPADIGAEQGGLFELDMAGIQGQTRSFLLTDLDSWQWENLSLPAGVRLAPFQCTVRTPEPITAVVRLAPEGIEGKLNAGPFSDLADALLATPSGRNLAVQMRTDGSFRAGSRAILPPDQFLTDAVLSDRQQRRQDLYRKFLSRKGPPPLAGRNMLLAWAHPVDTHFRLVPDARTVGAALLVVPLRLERPASGVRVTVPGPLVECRRVVGTRSGQARLTREARRASDMHLRFQLPGEVLPFAVERAHLTARIEAPGRRVTLAAASGKEFTEIHRVDSPLDPIRIDLTEAPFLKLDEDGGLHLRLTISDSLGRAASKKSPQEEEKWTIQFIELEVTGQRP
jgi:hypothetical protein